MFILRAIAAVILTLCLGLSAGAQTYPDYTSTTVNDFAGLLPPGEERALSDRLAQLERETGVEMTVVTLPSQNAYAPGMTLEAFATGLFNHWGVGKAATNDGVMVLILLDDRAMRLELGLAYGWDWDRVAQSVLDDAFLPAFRAGDYPRGIRQGTEATIERIVMPFREGRPAPDLQDAPQGDDLGPAAILAGFVATILALVARRRIADAVVRFRRCPNCGERALTARRRTVRAATRLRSGEGQRVLECAQCGHKSRSTYIIPRIRQTTSSGGSFGGGRSGGGGASGRW